MRNTFVRPLKRCLFILLGLVIASCASKQPALNSEILRFGDSKLRLEVAPEITTPRADVIAWVSRAAVAVTNYLGRFPVKEVVIRIHGGGGEPISDGVTHGASSIDVRLSPGVRASDFKEDWILTHEMFHLAFPTLDPRYLWMMEGLSDYLEPIARARAGQLTGQEVWREFVEGLPQGLPQPGDGGLDGTRRRERIYWGGNIYWLAADVRIRAQTGNRHSVDDAIRAILASGGDGGAVWKLDRVLQAGAKATGTTVLQDLYEAQGPKQGTVDLTDLWRQLGVRYRRGEITFDDQAPLAKVRQAITGEPRNPSPGL